MSIEYDDDEQCPSHRLMPVDRPSGLRIVGGRCRWRRQIEERHRPAAEGGEQPAGQGGLQRQCVKQPMDCLNTRCRGSSELSGETGWVRCYANRSTMGTRPDQDARAGGHADHDLEGLQEWRIHVAGADLAYRPQFEEYHRAGDHRRDPKCAGPRIRNEMGHGVADRGHYLVGQAAKPRRTAPARRAVIGEGLSGEGSAPPPECSRS